METVNFGKILLVDDKYDDDVEAAIKTLVKNGMTVQYWNSKGDFPEEITNVRIVILDLDLTDVGIRGPNFYSEAAVALNKIPGPFIVIILALDYNDDDPTNLKKYYEDKYQTPLCGFIATKGLTKTDERADPELLRNIILKSIGENEVLNFVLIWEQVVEKAKDLALHDLFEKELETTIMALIKSLCKDLGEEAATREMTTLVLQLVTRKVVQGKTFERFTTSVSKLNKSNLQKTKKYPTDNDLSLYSKLMFYKPRPEEGVSTGDIFKTGKEFHQYAIVLTPRCDIVQGKTLRVLMCYAVPLVEKLFENPKYPLHAIDPSVVKHHESKKTFPQIVKYMKERYFKEASLPGFLHILWNFCDGTETFGICFDFNNVQSIKVSDLKWERICRLDSPFIEEMLEKYGSVVSRVGTIDINQNTYQLSKSLDKLKKPK